MFPPTDQVCQEVQLMANLFAHGPKDWLHDSTLARANMDLGLKTCRCGRSHLYSIFFNSGVRFLLDYPNRVNKLKAILFDQDNLSLDVGALEAFECIHSTDQ